MDVSIGQLTKIIRARESLAVVGSLASGVVHDLNSPLHALSMGIDVVDDALGNGSCRPCLSPQDDDRLAALVAKRRATPQPVGSKAHEARETLRALFQTPSADPDGAMTGLCSDLGLWNPDPGTIEILSGASDNLVEAARRAVMVIEAVEIIRESSARLSALTRAYGLIGRAVRDAPTPPVSVAESLDSALAVCAPRFKGQLAVRSDFNGLSGVAMLPDAFGRVWLNLTLNAAEAMAAGGVLTVRARCEEGIAVVEFEDTGAGIPAENSSLVWEPFFTTKTDRPAAGLGLAEARAIVEAAGGSIDFESAPGRTVFRVRVRFAEQADPVHRESRLL